MHMSFWWGSVVGDFLFPGYTVKTTVAFLSTCFSLAVIAFIIEWLKLLETKQRQTELLLRSRQLRSVCPNENSNLIRDSKLPTVITLKHRVALYCCDIVLWLCTFNLSYFIMLAVMVYNGWFFVSILIGGGVGYFLFGHSFTKINLQNYKVIRQSYCVYTCPETEVRNGESSPAIASTSSIEGPPCHSLRVNVESEQ